MFRLSFAARTLLLSLLSAGVFAVLLLLALRTLHHTRAGYEDLLAEELATQDALQCLRTSLLACEREKQAFLLRRREESAERFGSEFARFKAETRRVRALLAASSSTDGRETFAEIEERAERYRGGFQALADSWRAMGLDHNSGLQGAFRSRVHELETLLGEEAIAAAVEGGLVLLLQLRRAEKDYLLRRLPKYVERAHRYLDRLLAGTAEANLAETRKEALRGRLQAYREGFDALVAEHGRSLMVAASMEEEAIFLEASLASLAAQASASAEATTLATARAVARQSRVLIGTMLAGVVLFILLTGISAQRNRRTTHAIREIAEELMAGARELDATSSRLSGASGETAGASREQSASVQETSASLAQIASMARRNSADIESVRRLAGETLRAASEGSGRVEALSAAMETFRASSENLDRINGTIDEIAFQTNILALNAAVEAARAGESGAGFAVVADEVRNLARRSAEAARDSSRLIAESAERSRAGLRLNEEVAAGLTEILNRSRELDGLTGKLAAATGEQREGVEQIHRAMDRIDTITQAHVSAAAASAHSSQELARQSGELRRSLRILRTLAGGDRRRAAEPTATVDASDRLAADGAHPSPRAGATLAVSR